MQKTRYAHTPGSLALGLLGTVLWSPACLAVPPSVAGEHSATVRQTRGEVPATRFEVSYNYLEEVELPSAQPRNAEMGLARGPAPTPGVPFPTEPDWINQQRRQVGGLDIADLNGDGRPDLAAGCYNSPSFPPYDDWHNFVHYGTGIELESLPSWVSADQVSTGEIAIGRINADAFPDLFAANGGSAMAPSVIYFGGAAGPSTTSGWSAADVSWTNHVVLFDFDHDNDLDVATANQGNSQLDPHRPMFFYRNDAGSLETNPSWQSAESSIQGFLAVGDLDGDTWEDLAVSKWVGFETGYYRNLAGTLDTTPIWTSGSTDSDRGVAIADFDGVMGADLVVGQDPTQLYLNDGSGNLSPDWTATGTFFGHQDLLVCDVDLDGDQDLIEVHFASGVANLYRNDDGSLASSPTWSYDSSAVGTALACGDLNGDQWPDLAVGNAGEPSILVFYNRLGGFVLSDGFESGDLVVWN